MKPKQLVPLIVVLAALIGLVVVRQSQNKPASLEQQYALKTLLPDGIDTASLTKIEMYAGAKPDDKLVLERAPDSTKWTIASKFGAPVNQDRIDGYLKTLQGLQGEFRAEVNGEEEKAYNLDTDSGFHVLGYANGEEPKFHLINGKSPDFGKAFVRTADNSAAYVIDKSLRREAGIYTLEMGDAPEATHWLDKTVLELDSEKIKAVALQYPDKQLAFELQKKEPAAAEAAPAEGADAGESAGEPADKTEEWNWVVTQGGPGTEFHSNAASNLARRLSRVVATDIVDPANKAEYGLETPAYRATITVEGYDAPVVLEAGRPAGDTYAYVRMAGADRDRVYKVSGFDVEQIFQKGGEFFELPGVLVEKSDATSIEYSVGGQRVALAQDAGAWTIVSPATNVAIVKTAVDDLARTLLSWKADDYADSADGKFDGATDSVTFKGPDASHTITLGAVAPGEGRYVRLDDDPTALVMSEQNVATILKPYAGLFESALFDFDEEAIQSVSIAKGETAFRLESAPDETWSIAIGETSEPADDEKVMGVLVPLVDLTAQDFEFGDTRKPGDIFGTVAIKLADGTEHTLSVESSAEGRFPVTVPGTSATYLVPAQQIARIFVEPDSLKPAPPPAVTDEPAEGGESNDAPQTAEPATPQ